VWITPDDDTVGAAGLRWDQRFIDCNVTEWFPVVSPLLVEVFDQLVDINPQ